MKNWLNLATLILVRISRLTRQQQVILIGSIILPGGTLILIFSQYGLQIIRKLTKAKTLRIFGKLMSEDEMWDDLTQRS
jgi:hypothetical protein